MSKCKLYKSKAVCRTEIHNTAHEARAEWETLIAKTRAVVADKREEEK
jgi:hypothetical protein